jgi:hypothetical protein
LPPEAVSRWPQSGQRTPVLGPRIGRSALSSSFRVKILGIAGR